MIRLSEYNLECVFDELSEGKGLTIYHSGIVVFNIDREWMNGKWKWWMHAITKQNRKEKWWWNISSAQFTWYINHTILVDILRHKYTISPIPSSIYFQPLYSVQLYTMNSTLILKCNLFSSIYFQLNCVNCSPLIFAQRLWPFGVRNSVCATQSVQS